MPWSTRSVKLKPVAVVTLAVCGLMLVGPSVRAQGAATSVDPEALQGEIAANPDFDVAALWRTLRIPAQLDTVYAKVVSEPIDTPKVSFDRCANTCLAELTRVNVDDDPATEVVLAVYQEAKACRFLVFKTVATTTAAAAAAPPRWRLLGYADHDALGQYAPEYRVSQLGNRRYLVVSAPGAHGTGTWVNYERWYEASATGMHEVLSLPVDGVECLDARSLCRAFASTVVSGASAARRDELVVSFTVRYWGDEFLLGNDQYGEIPLFARSQRGIYGRPPKTTGSFALAPLDSQIANWEIDKVFRPEAMTCQDFLVFNPDELATIASGAATPAKAWLSRYVNGCAASDQRSQLLQALGK